jgi:hypothetical protein
MQFIQELREKIASGGLNRLVTARLNAEGYKLAELDLPTAMAILGMKIYEKNAQYRRIIGGLKALQEVDRA